MAQHPNQNISPAAKPTRSEHNLLWVFIALLAFAVLAYASYSAYRSEAPYSNSNESGVNDGRAGQL